MKPHLRRVLRAAALLSTTAALALLPVTAAEAAAKIEVRPHNALGTVARRRLLVGRLRPVHDELAHLRDRHQRQRILRPSEDHRRPPRLPGSAVLQPSGVRPPAGHDLASRPERVVHDPVRQGPGLPGSLRRQRPALRDQAVHLQTLTASGRDRPTCTPARPTSSRASASNGNAVSLRHFAVIAQVRSDQLSESCSRWKSKCCTGKRYRSATVMNSRKNGSHRVGYGIPFARLLSFSRSRGTERHCLIPCRRRARTGSVCRRPWSWPTRSIDARHILSCTPWRSPTPASAPASAQPSPRPSHRSPRPSGPNSPSLCRCEQSPVVRAVSARSSRTRSAPTPRPSGACASACV